MKAYLEVRSQKSKGKWPKSGPDIYVAIQIVPNGVSRLKYLNHKVANKRGIKIIYIGEGYSKNKGPKSSYGIALKKAREYIQNLTGEKV